MQIKVFTSLFFQASQDHPYAVSSVSERQIFPTVRIFPFYSGGQAGMLEATWKVLISSEMIIQGLAVPETLSATFNAGSGCACCLMVPRYDFKVFHPEYLVFRTT